MKTVKRINFVKLVKPLPVGMFLIGITLLSSKTVLAKGGAFSLSDGKAFSKWQSELGSQIHGMGEFTRRMAFQSEDQKLQKAFEAADRKTRKFLQREDILVQIMTITPEGVSFTLTDSKGRSPLQVSSKKTSSSIKNSQVLREGLRLVIEDRSLSSFSVGKDTKGFVQWSEIENEEKKLEAGATVQNFTLSIFARQFQTHHFEENSIGAALSSRVELPNGWNFLVRAEVSEADQTTRVRNIQVTEGKYRTVRSSGTNAFVRVEVQKNFGDSGFQVASGFRLRAYHLEDDQKSLFKELFLSLSQTLRIKKMDIGKITLLGVRQMDSQTGINDWMMMLQVGFEF